MRLRFEHSKDHLSGNHQDHFHAGFVGGGGIWLIETVYNKHSDFWANRWEVTDSNASDRKIWTVNYGKILSNQQTVNFESNLEDIKKDLSRSLKGITQFAHQRDMQNWEGIFKKAYSTLYSPNPYEDYYHKDLIVLKNYGLLTKQVLFAAGNAWVFGGMGSWNDIGFEDKDDNNLYESLSTQLYKNICQAIVASINSY